MNFISLLISGVVAAFGWLLLSNKKQEIEKLEKEVAEKDSINKELQENAEIKKIVDNSDFAELSRSLRKKRKTKNS
jgi:uncharacterized protein YacL